MEPGYADLRRTITWMATAIATLTVLALPGGYAYTALTYEGTHMEELAERLGTLMSKQAYLFPDWWHFSAIRLSEAHFVVQHSRYPIMARVLDVQHIVLHQIGEIPQPPVLRRAAIVHDGAHTVGHVEVTESVRFIWYRTVLAALGSTGLALGMFVVLRLLPLQALSRSLQALAVSQHNLLQAQEELRRQERMATLGQVTAMVSHELRNPLGSIRTCLFAIRRLLDRPPPLLQNALDIADRNITRCDTILGDLLDFTRRRELRYVDVALDDWLATTLTTYAMPPEITLHQRLTSGVTVAIDQDRLYRVMLNVLDNACQAMQETSAALSERPQQITVATQVVESYAAIVLDDSGPGMPPEVLQHIFEPLYSTKSFGVGLGLSIVKQIMEQHGGSVTVCSTPGHGTRVQLLLPQRLLAKEET